MNKIIALLMGVAVSLLAGCSDADALFDNPNREVPSYYQGKSAVSAETNNQATLVSTTAHAPEVDAVSAANNQTTTAVSSTPKAAVPTNGPAVPSMSPVVGQ